MSVSLGTCFLSGPFEMPNDPNAATHPAFPDIGDLTRHLHFSPENGRIWVRDHRGVLLNATAFTAMRKGIIDQIGLAAARNLYSLIGYAEGTRDAEAVRKVRPNASSFDAFAVGLQAHALYGLGWAEVVDMSMNSDTGEFAGDFLVHDSMEASAHLESFGPSLEPTCWMATGYASGFTSAFVGRPCVYHESECKGMGGSRCRLIGRPLDESDATESAHGFFRPAPQINRFTTQPNHDTGPLPDVIGISAGFRTALHYLEKAAPSKATLLFHGETGVGKEVFARLAHDMSPRRNGPFVAVNCGALPENLIESELFGVMRGAFTGAHNSRPGRFERAQGGTLFLDEVSTLSQAAQVKLLRALQEGEIERVGDVSGRKVDVRVMAAANVDLRDAVRRQEFREDLYFRIATFPIQIPPLRERRDDIPLLMEHFRTRYCKAHGRRTPGFTSQAVVALLAHPLPGNIRELEHRIERAVLLANDDEALDIGHLFQGDENVSTTMLGLDDSGALRVSNEDALRRCAHELLDAVDENGKGFDAIEKEILEAAVSAADGNLAGAARRLGLTRRTVAVRLERLRKAQRPDE
tara:strand:- start:3193 stop:4932 length:1740 start_codon:yes stop_codon:yes gene_type:complete